MARRGEGAAVGASVHAAPGVAFECSQRRAQHRASKNLAHLRPESVRAVRVSAACRRESAFGTKSHAEDDATAAACRRCARIPARLLA
jgi:hypothetical protein